MYKAGLFGGSFDPLHMGHVNTITKIASMCKELHIILSYSLTQDSIDYKRRYQWLIQSTNHLENVEIHAVEYECNSKSGYNWSKGTEDILKAVGKEIDVVFCGDDYAGTDIFERCYKDKEIKYISRREIQISSSEIKANPYRNWEYIPLVVRPYYVKKVLILGSESTGKSTLAANLALIYNTVYSEEVAREICCGRSKFEDMMIEEDFCEIMIKHRAKEYEKLLQANKVMFTDTDCITTLFYKGFLYPNTDSNASYKRLASGISELNKYDAVIFLKPDVEFVQDGTRNENIMREREKCSDMLQRTLINNGIGFIEIGGTHLERLEAASKIVDSLIGGIYNGCKYD